MVDISEDDRVMLHNMLYLPNGLGYDAGFAWVERHKPHLKVELNRLYAEWGVAEEEGWRPHLQAVLRGGLGETLLIRFVVANKLLGDDGIREEHLRKFGVAEDFLGADAFAKLHTYLREFEGMHLEAVLAPPKRNSRHEGLKFVLIQLYCLELERIVEDEYSTVPDEGEQPDVPVEASYQMVSDKNDPEDEPLQMAAE